MSRKIAWALCPLLLAELLTLPGTEALVLIVVWWVVSFAWRRLVANL